MNRERELYQESQPTKETPSVSKRTESGTFIRTIIRRDGKKSVKTRIIKPNPCKVTLGHLGDLEVYVYPYDFPNRIFFGKYPFTMSLDRQDINKLFSIANISRWFLNESPYSKRKTTKAAKALRESIQRAYEIGQNRQRT